MRRFVRDNALGLCFLVLFLLALLGQSISGTAEFNNQQVSQGAPPVSWASYVTSADFTVDMAENWQSEYLQFLLFIVFTVWLVQRGSPESKAPGEEGLESDRRQKVGPYAERGSPRWARASDWRRTVYESSLGLVMGVIFVLAWLGQAIAGLSAYNSQQIVQLEDPVTWQEYLVSADFWNRTLQNWQSEFLAVASITVLAVYLRQRGSPQSKPVGDPHGRTASQG
jgi:flagellar biogenesis protein FliO